MRKIILPLSFIFIVISVLLPYYSFAQTATPSTIREQKRLEQQERLEEKKVTLSQKRIEQQERNEEKKASREAQLELKRREKIRYFWGLLRRRLIAAAERIEKLIDRMESRLAKIEELGEDDVDLADIYLQLDEASDLLSDVMDDIKLADIQIEDALTAEEPKLLFTEVISIVKSIKKDLIQIHKLLVHLIGDIKGLRVGQSGNVTETPKVTITVPVTPTPLPTEAVTATVVPTP